MTNKEWVIFILFTIGINVIIQKIAWEIGVSIAKKKREAKKADMRKGEKLMCLTCKPIEPKDESWWDDMDRDAQDYLESLEQEAKDGE